MIDAQVVNAQNAANSARQMLLGAAGGSQNPRGEGIPRSFIDMYWMECVRRNQVAASQGFEAQMAAAKEAEAVMNAIRALDEPHWNALGATERRAQSGRGGYFPEEAVAVAAAIASSLVLAKFQAGIDEVEEARAAERAETQRLTAEQWERDAPARTLKWLRDGGIFPSVTKSGDNIALAPDQATQLTDSDVLLVKKHKAAIVALLKSEADAARPVVIA